MCGRDYFRMFIAGMVFPGLVFPCVSIFLAANNAILFLQEVPIYLMSFIWGLWNVLYFVLVKPRIDHVPNTRVVFGLHGVLLGLFVYLFATLVFHLPILLGIPSWLAYLAVLIIPTIYYFVWYYIVVWINDLLNFHV